MRECLQRVHKRLTVRMRRGTYQGSDGTHNGSPGGSIRPALRDRFAWTHGKRNRCPQLIASLRRTLPGVPGGCLGGVTPPDAESNARLIRTPASRDRCILIFILSAANK
jgi:hypothetical protein